MGILHTLPTPLLAGPARYAPPLSTVQAKRRHILHPLRPCPNNKCPETKRHSPNTIITNPSSVRLVLPLIGIIIIASLQCSAGFINPHYTYKYCHPTFFDWFVAPVYYIFFNGARLDPVPGIAWTLVHEWQGSIAVYTTNLVLLLYTPTSRARWFILAVVMLWTVLCHKWTSHFIAGMILAQMDVTGLTDRIRRSHLGVFATLLAVYVVIHLTFHSDYTLGATTDTFLRSFQLNSHGTFGVEGGTRDHWAHENVSQLVLSFAILVGVEVSTGVQSILSLMPFVFLGRVSFALYLYHHTLIDSFGEWVFVMIPPTTFATRAANLGINVVVLLVVSEILTRIVDVPSVYLSKWVAVDLLGGNLSMTGVFEVVKRRWETVYGAVKGGGARSPLLPVSSDDSLEALVDNEPEQVKSDEGKSC